MAAAKSSKRARKSSAQNSAKTKTKRQPRGKPFQPGNPWRIPPGQTLNPGGRPKLLSHAYLDWLEAENEQGITNAAGSAIALGKKVLQGNVPAIREMRRATEGDTFKIDLSKLTDEQLERISNGEDPGAVLALRAKAALELRRRKNLGLKQTERGLEYSFYGANAEFWACRQPEFMLSGPAQTGKTITGLALLNALALANPGSQWAIVRKVRADMAGSVLQIFWNKVLGPLTHVRKHGGENVEFYEYENLSRIWVGGMDRPGKVLSGERDGVYVNQAEELKIEDWETLLTRTTGRSGALHDAGGVPYGVLFGDCNPDAPTHWLWTRQLSGKLKMFHSRHQDNPSLYDQATGAITEFGVRTMEILGRLTGYRKSRLLGGLWVLAEGIIFDTWVDLERTQTAADADAGNVTELAEYDPEGSSVLWALDDGYSAGSAIDGKGLSPETGEYVADAHPRVILFCQLKADGRLDVFDEYYACLALSDTQIGAALERPYRPPEYAAHGPGQSEIRGRLYAANIMPHKVQVDVDELIKQLRERLAADKNGWRGVRVHPRCKHLRSEMVSYAYEPGTGKPVKAFDHGPDALRYLAWVLRNRSL